MNFFKIKTCWTNSEFIIFKLCIATAYIIVGTYFHDFFSSYYIPLFIIFGLTLIPTVFMWLDKMKHGNKG
jgi:hypothetical protein